MDRLTRAEWLAGVVTAPVILLMVAWAAVLAIALATGHHPIWNLEPQSLSEAAAFRDGGAVVRRIDGGDDPDAAGTVRPGFISDEPMTLAPIEAAAATRASEIVQLLLDLGASPDAATWQRAWCMSKDRDVRAVLASKRPPGSTEECEEEQ